MTDTFQPARRSLLAATVSAGVASLAGLMPSATFAQERGYPNRPIRFVVPFSAGSGTDTLARLYAKALGDVLKQSVVVENKAGANGIIGAKTVLNAPADGYTLFFASNSTLTTNVAVIRDLPYDPLRDFDPISVLDGGYCVLVVPATSPYRTLADLIAEARKRPGALNHAAGSPTYALWNEWFSEIARIKTTNIFYKGSGDAATAAVSGQVDYAIIGAGTTSQMVASGRLRALVYTGKAPHPNFPGVPTSAQAGVDGFGPLAWSAVAVRAGTPAPVVRELERAFSEAIRKPEVLSSLARMGSESLYSGAAGMRRFQLEEIERWKRLIATTGISVQ
ncbi:Bug family tripartite tricarboxylate transporter substrate binding protein [Cupriavidus alkaliphilus]|uniref:Bug family tripartite tricarboxylate transporter substrate binding protein n=1 Tax=Cupriavidus alkaliphilus TaxID=942866 RepID=UPI001615D336|nr:tripartite tricarboxylate transporter substrate binding protein [Cupriavidus alkaliphilus]MBB2919331.1 tripartite-type tricarboxylate transporter receptor subunit TctC [Cupriavidus alkaliphilus]